MGLLFQTMRRFVSFHSDEAAESLWASCEKLVPSPCVTEAIDTSDWKMYSLADNDAQPHHGSHPSHVYDIYVPMRPPAETTADSPLVPCALSITASCSRAN
jgi:hypothetical protein